MVDFEEIVEPLSPMSSELVKENQEIDDEEINYDDLKRRMWKDRMRMQMFKASKRDMINSASAAASSLVLDLDDESSDSESWKEQSPFKEDVKSSRFHPQEKVRFEQNAPAVIAAFLPKIVEIVFGSSFMHGSLLHDLQDTTLGSSFLPLCNIASLTKEIPLDKRPGFPTLVANRGGSLSGLIPRVLTRTRTTALQEAS
ncbi:hypothetical protein HAX54_007643 [Datura stramonium]|uniref:Uncharacterized protein n=1 Tax=Datura stramonium TaxID=4076 RepID=A0ABS8TC47_DATST|nr:hypothetical protein [Datura stramonium]